MRKLSVLAGLALAVLATADPAFGQCSFLGSGTRVRVIERTYAAPPATPAPAVKERVIERTVDPAPQPAVKERVIERVADPQPAVTERVIVRDVVADPGLTSYDVIDTGPRVFRFREVGYDHFQGRTVFVDRFGQVRDVGGGGRNVQLGLFNRSSGGGGGRNFQLGLINRN